MEEITVRKEELKAKLVENKSKHRKIFEEALEGYHNEGIRLLSEHLERLKNNKRENVFIQLPVPQDHTRDYERIIAMLEMEVNDELVLSEQEFAQFVMDDWQWKRQWVTSNSAYSMTAAAEAKQYE